MTERSFLRIEAVMARTGYSRSGLYRAMASGAFPIRPFTLPGTRLPVWDSAEIANFLDRVAATAPREEV